MSLHPGPWDRAAVPLLVDSLAPGRLGVRQSAIRGGGEAGGAAHAAIPPLMKALREKQVDVPVILGGIVPKDAEAMVKQHGVVEVFHPGTDLETIVSFIQSIAGDRKGGKNG